MLDTPLSIRIYCGNDPGASRTALVLFLTMVSLPIQWHTIWKHTLFLCADGASAYLTAAYIGHGLWYSSHPTSDLGNTHTFLKFQKNRSWCLLDFSYIGHGLWLYALHLTSDLGNSNTHTFLKFQKNRSWCLLDFSYIGHGLWLCLASNIIPW
jgi:hypothetical protein